MKISELHQKSNEELEDLLQEKRTRVDELHFLLFQKKTKNTKEQFLIKKDIARILTTLKENARTQQSTGLK